MTTIPAKAVPPKVRVRVDPRPRPEARPGRVRGRAAVLDAPRQERTRSAAAQRGYARKAQRQADAGPRIRTARRAPFVLLVMALLATGLITSLWLSTAAAADSYRLDGARREARDLTERAEQLRQDVAAMQTAPQLAQRALDLGMVRVDEPARLVRQPDGTVVVIGTPAQATAPASVQSSAPPTDPNHLPVAQQPPAQRSPPAGDG